MTARLGCLALLARSPTNGGYNASITNKAEYLTHVSHYPNWIVRDILPQALKQLHRCLWNFQTEALGRVFFFLFPTGVKSSEPQPQQRCKGDWGLMEDQLFVRAAGGSGHKEELLPRHFSLFWIYWTHWRVIQTIIWKNPKFNNGKKQEYCHEKHSIHWSEIQGLLCSLVLCPSVPTAHSKHIILGMHLY